MWTGQEPGWDSPINRGSHCCKGAAVRDDVLSERRLRYPTDTVDKVRNRLGEVPEHLLTVIFSLGLAAPVAASSCTVPQGLP